MALPEQFPSHSDYFESCLNFLRDYEWTYNFPNTELLVKNVLDNFPTEWKICFNNMTFEELCRLPANYANVSWTPSLKKFFHELDILKSNFPREILTEFGTSSDTYRPKDLNRHAIGMSKKKQHEVANLVAQIEKYCDDVNIIIDIGSGLGYLSQYLHAKCDYFVLGIEASETNIRSARSRQSKWFPNTLRHVQYVQHRVTSNSAEKIYEYLNNTQWDLSKGVCMVGLHTCGDLICSTIDIYTLSNFIKKLVVMPCCYHKMQFEGTDGVEIFSNFPSSQSLKQKWKNANCARFLKRPFLRLACQQRPSSWGCFDDRELELRVFKLLSRAVLELYVKKENLLLIKNKRKTAKTHECDGCFETYLKEIETGYTIKHSLQNKEKEEQSFEKHSIQLKQLWKLKCVVPFNVKLITGAFLILQACLQPVCENLLLLDKIERLNESIDVESSKFVKITDESLSARCFCLLSTKKNS